MRMHKADYFRSQHQRIFEMALKQWLKTLDKRRNEPCYSDAHAANEAVRLAGITADAALARFGVQVQPGVDADEHDCAAVVRIKT